MSKIKLVNKSKEINKGLAKYNQIIKKNKNKIIAVFVIILFVLVIVLAYYFGIKNTPNKVQNNNETITEESVDESTEGGTEGSVSGEITHKSGVTIEEEAVMDSGDSEIKNASLSTAVDFNTELDSSNISYVSDTDTINYIPFYYLQNYEISHKAGELWLIDENGGMFNTVTFKNESSPNTMMSIGLHYISENEEGINKIMASENTAVDSNGYTYYYAMGEDLKSFYVVYQTTGIYFVFNWQGDTDMNDFKINSMMAGVEGMDENGNPIEVLDMPLEEQQIDTPVETQAVE